MIPNTKISQTLSDFASSMVNQLPHDYTKQELETVMSFVITVWNAVTVDAWEKSTQQEKAVLDALGTEREALLAAKRLIKRKKTKFGQDLRAVGDHWVREESDGGLIFGCTANINLDMMKLPGKH
ncbi:MAG: hypothetical protein ACJAVV_003866 [Alphaproteobacteria bacterium]|jgi:hypothetical protein